MLDAALDLRARGLAVFPVSRYSKSPLVAWGGLEATLPAEDEVRKWFAAGTCDVGVAMGPVSGLFCLDLDTAKHPEAAAWWAAHRLEIPATWEETTKSGGRHYYFRWNDAVVADRQTNTQSKICVGVDTKGAGGYAKMAPSDGYTWVIPPTNGYLADIPAWLVALLPSKHRPATPAPQSGESRILSDLDSINAEDSLHGRTPTFCRVIGVLKRRGLTIPEVTAFLKPWADKHEYADRIGPLVEDLFRRYPATAPTGAFVPGSGKTLSIAEFLKEPEAIEWICPPYFPKRGIGFVAGLPETYKTWALIDLAVECASANPGLWLGRYPVRAGRVLFVDQERFKGETQRRFRAVIQGKGLAFEEFGDRLGVRCDMNLRLDMPLSVAAFRQELETTRPDLVIIDSFATVQSAENGDRSGAQAVMERVKEFRKEFGCTVIFIEHESKNAFMPDEDEPPSAIRMLGSVGKLAAAEFALTVRRHDSRTCFVYHTKSTMAEAAAPMLVQVRDLDDQKTRIAVEAV